MAVLPTANLDLATGVTFQKQPSLTWFLDQASGRIRGTVDNLEAVRQAVEIILHVERFRWQLYRPYSGLQWEGLVGQSPHYVASEVRRRMEEALQMDDRVLGISAFSYTTQADMFTASITVSTVYGEIQTQTEVQLS